MPADHKETLDPLRAILGVIALKNDPDLLLRIVGVTGLPFDQNFSQAENKSRKSRTTALGPRIVEAYQAVSEMDKLAVARVILSVLNQSHHRPIYKEVAQVLEKIGWAVRDGELVAATPDIREMFFPKGSPWDARVALRDFFAEATTEIVIVDAYCDSAVFEILKQPAALNTLRVNILCSKHADGLWSEAKTFVAQYPKITIEVRRTKDFHDRFIVIDRQHCIHSGASINTAGNTAFMISRIEDEENRKSLLASIAASWNEGRQVL